MPLKLIESKLIALAAQKSLLTTQKREVGGILKSMEADLINTKKALALCTTVAEETQNEFGEQLSALVTSCLQIVMEDSVYEFKIKFESKRNATSVAFLLLKDGEEQELMGGSGGGVVQLCSVALRLALHQMKTPGSRNTIIIDEGLSALRGRDNMERVYKMLDTMSEKLGVQIIMISNASDDIDLLEPYNVIKLENVDGVANII
jgi:hypothetical protein